MTRALLVLGALSFASAVRAQPAPPPTDPPAPPADLPASPADAAPPNEDPAPPNEDAAPPTDPAPPNEDAAPPADPAPPNEDAAPPADAPPTPTPPDDPPAPAAETDPESTGEAPTGAAGEPPLFGQPSLRLRDVRIHGFVSQGGFVSTSNDYIGNSSSGSLELFEAGINFSLDATDRLRAGVQLFARDFGAFEDASPRLDWALLDYRWRPWLGLRAGVVKMPVGLYNEYTDIDSARLSILLPQSVYAVRNRDVLLSHRGFSIYGNPLLGEGELEYELWLGSLNVPANALIVEGATLDDIDSKYVAGARVLWHPPLEGLRVGATALRASFDFNLTLAPATVEALIMAGVVPADYDGSVVISQDPVTMAVASVEYIRDRWLFAAEYARARTHQESTLPEEILPHFDEDNEMFYAMASYRLSPLVELGGYYSVLHSDANDRRGRDPKWPEPYYAYQRDLSATIRFDINHHWLFKLEAHFIDGVAALVASENPDPDRYWGMFLFKTTATF